jgi:rhodanese-related sulfurtransferase
LIQEIDCHELADTQNQHKALLVDVREIEELEESGTIEGSLHWPLSSFEDFAEEIPKYKAIIFFCRSGRRSITAANLAKEHAADATHFSLRGGFIAYASSKR